MPVDLETTPKSNYGTKTLKGAAKRTKSNVAKVGTKIAQPVKDSFHKKYGDDVKPTPKLVADFAADKIITFAVAGIGTILVFNRMKGATNGLTKALSEAKKNNGIRKMGQVLKETTEKVKGNNQTDDILKESRKTLFNALTDEKTSIIDGIKGSAKNIFRSKESFNVESKLGKGIKKIFGDKADKIENGLAKLGIDNGHALADTVIALGLTGVASDGLSEISQDVTEADDAELANQSRLKTLIKNTSDAAKVVMDINEKFSALGDC